MSMLIVNETKQWRKCVPTLTTIFGTYTMKYHFFVIKALDTNMTLGVHGFITLKKDTLDCEILQKVGEYEKDGQHKVIGNINTHHFQEVYAQKQEDDLCSEGKEKSIHSHIQPALGIDVSLHGRVP